MQGGMVRRDLLRVNRTDIATLTVNVLTMTNGSSHTHSDGEGLFEGLDDEFRCCLLAVGELGERLASSLTQRAAQGVAPWNDMNLKLSSRVHPFGLADRDIKNLVANRYIVFLFGSVGDPIFQSIRKQVLASKPEMLFTMGVTSPANPLAGLAPAEGEGILLFPEPANLDEVIRFMQHLYSPFAFPGFICMDVADVRSVCEGAFLTLLTYETNVKTDMGSLRAFLGANAEVIRGSRGIVSISSFGDSAKMSLGDFEGPVGVLTETTTEEQYVVAGLDWQSRIDADYRMYLLCASEKQRG